MIGTAKHQILIVGGGTAGITVAARMLRKGYTDSYLQLEPSFPLLNPTTPHRAYWYLKNYGLPFMYWNLMLKGLV